MVSNDKSGLQKPAWLKSLLTALLLLPLYVGQGSARQGEPRVSRPGQYRGYSQAAYDSWERTSKYVRVRDGTLLAADIFRPTKDGKPASEPLPVVWAYDRYQRASGSGFRLVTQLDEEFWLQELVRHGYVVAVVDGRGSGASFGTWDGPFTREEAHDTYDITEWLAAQPWCDKQVGMFGRSYLGVVQYLAAGEAPPHLKAIFPEMAMFDLYDAVYPGGVFRGSIVMSASRSLKALDSERPPAPVTEDADGSLLARALEGRAQNKDVGALYAALPFRDSKEESSGHAPFIQQNPQGRLEAIRKSGVAVYHLGGWLDAATRDSFLWFRNLSNPQKITVGPWSHTGTQGFDLAAEHLRWYDHWLKGIENGIMDEPPVYYYTAGAREGEQWRAADRWPLPNEVATRYFFRADKSGSVKSIQDGLLSPEPPAEAEGQDEYVTNYTTTSGAASRWASGVGGQLSYPDMRPNDEKALTYTTQQLTEALEVTGHPSVNIWVSSSAADGDFFVYMEDVDASGRSAYVTEGVLRASHRATFVPSYDYAGLNSYHRSFASDVKPLPPEPAELTLDLQPTSKIFLKGHRIRITLTAADVNNASTPSLTPPPVVKLFRNARFLSHITLPVIPGATARAASEGDLESKVPQNEYRYYIALAFICLFVALLLWLAFRRRKKR